MAGSVVDRGPSPESSPGRIQSEGRATGLAMVGAVVATAANFGIALLIAGASTTLAGLFFATTAIVAIAGNSTALGTMTGLVYHLPTALAAERPNPRSVFLLALGPVLILSAVVAMVLALVSGPLAGVLADGERARVADMLVILAPAIPCWALGVTALGATRGLGSMTPTVLVNQIVRPLGQLVLITAVIVTADEPSASAIATAWLVPVVVGAVVAVVAVVRMGGLRAEGRPVVTRAEFWRYTRPRAASAAGQIALERSDVILVSALAGEAAAGVYGTVTRFVTAGNFLVFAMGQATSGPLRRALVAGRRPEAQHLLDRATAWMVLSAGTYFLLVSTKAEALVRFVNDDLSTGATALSVAAVAMVVNAAAGPVDLTLLMLGRSRASLAATAGALVIDLAVAWVTIPRLGLVGAALAWGFAVVFQNLVAAALVRRHGRLLAFARPARQALVVAVVAIVPVALVSPGSFAGLVITGVVGGLIVIGWAVARAPTLGLDVGPVVTIRRRLPSRWAHPGTRRVRETLGPEAVRRTPPH